MLVFFTGKKDGHLRPCFDNRKLNTVMVKNRYPLLLNMDLGDSLRNANTFTKLELLNSYRNLHMAEGDRNKLAFICQEDHFAPLTIPFGSTGSLGHFQYFIQDLLLGRIGHNLAAYLDNIMICNQKGLNNQAAVSSVLGTLSKNQMWLKPEKGRFFKREVKYLGLIIA